MNMLRVQWITFLSFIALAPVFNVQGTLGARDVQELFLKYAGMGLFTLFIGNLWLTLFFLWTLFLHIYNGIEVGQTYVLNIFVGLCLFTISRKIFKKFNFSDIALPIVSVAALSILWMGLQRLGIDPLYGGTTGGRPALSWHFKDMPGLFGLKSAQGIFFALAIPFIMDKNVLISLLMLIPIWFCESSAAMVAGLFALSWSAYWNKYVLFVPVIYPRLSMRKISLAMFFPSFGWRGRVFRVMWWKVLCVLFLAGSVFYIGFKDYKADPKMLLSRFNVWHAAGKYSLMNPFGYGPDSVRAINRSKQFFFMGDEERRLIIAEYRGKNEQGQDQLKMNYYDMDAYKARTEYQGIKAKSHNYWDSLHNEVIQLLFEFGFPSIILLFLLTREMVQRFRFCEKSPDLILITGVLMVYAVSSTTQFPLHLARLAFLFPIALGAFYCRTDGQRQLSY